MSHSTLSSKQRYREFVAETRVAPNVVHGPTDQFDTNRSLLTQLKLRRHHWPLLRTGVRDFGILAAWSILGMMLDVIWPLTSAYLVDRVVLSRSLDAQTKARYLLTGAVGISAVFVGNSVLTWLRIVRTQLVTSKIQVGLRERLYRRILRLSLGDLHRLRTGELLSRLSHDVELTVQLVQLVMLGPTVALFRLITIVSVIFYLDYRVATAVLLTVPPLLLMQAIWSNRTRRIWRSAGQDRHDVDARITEALGGIRVVRGFGRERREELVHAAGLHTVVRKEMLALRIQRGANMLWDVAVPFSQIIAVCCGGYLVVQGKTTVGTMVAFQGFLFRLLEPVLALVRPISETQRGLAALDRISELLNLGHELAEAPGSMVAPSLVDEIRFVNVAFAYMSGVPVLQHFNLSVRGNCVVALVGPSGAGKTTITDLIARFYDPTAGAVLLNGVDLRRYGLESYRRCIGIVSQEVFLFDGTVGENIGYGCLTATRSEIEAAAHAANAHEFISRLPAGYDTLVGERGVRLSGGQRQRLSIARAILANPQILIFDEATCSIDTESERLIQEALTSFLARRTAFIIAHRLSTVMHADMIVVFNNGQIIETGSHDELVARKGAYCRMITQQRHDGGYFAAPSD